MLAKETHVDFNMERMRNRIRSSASGSLNRTLTVRISVHTARISWCGNNDGRPVVLRVAFVAFLLMRGYPEHWQKAIRVRLLCTPYSVWIPRGELPGLTSVSTSLESSHGTALCRRKYCTNAVPAYGSRPTWLAYFSSSFRLIILLASRRPTTCTERPALSM